jgi:hypothetical protein
MFFRVVALFVLAIWLGLNVIGYAADDDFGNYNVPSIIVADNQDSGDDLNSYRLFNFAALPAVFHLNPLELIVGQRVAKALTIVREDRKPFEMKCAFLL